MGGTLQAILGNDDFEKDLHHVCLRGSSSMTITFGVVSKSCTPRTTYSIGCIPSATIPGCSELSDLHASPRITPQKQRCGAPSSLRAWRCLRSGLWCSFTPSRRRHVRELRRCDMSLAMRRWCDGKSSSCMRVWRGKGGMAAPIIMVLSGGAGRAGS